MQNNENSRKSAFRKFFQEKGYYIVLFLCIAAVGISGYLFVTGAVSEKNSLEEEPISVAASAAVPAETSVATKATTPSTAVKEPEKPAAAVETEPKVMDITPARSDEAVRDAAAAIRVWPITGETVAEYSMDQLSYNETTHDWRTHDGVDLAAQAGEPVRAACGGTVSAVYDDEFFGTTVVISHDDGYSTHYSNLAAMPTVSAGSTVAAGDTIGSVGSTAILESGTETHLHFAVYQNGEAVDPSSFVD